MATAPPLAIELKELSLTIGSRRLLDSVSIHAEAGERIALVGPNGAGKTTLLRCLLGFTPVEQGQITLQGKSQTQFSRQELARMIGYVPQQLSDDIPFTVLEFIIMNRYAHAGGGFIPKDHEGEKLAKQVTERTGIQHLENQTMSTLSGGERQKVNIAAALAKQTPILVLDEPTAHLDPKQQESIQQLLSEVGRNSHTTILTVTHDLNWAAMDFDRVIGMSHGSILADDVPARFMTQENLRNIFDAEWTIQPHPQNGCPMILPTHHSKLKTQNSN